jgi:hypothetical protein
VWWGLPVFRLLLVQFVPVRLVEIVEDDGRVVS